jgi:CBS domain-containing protein
MASTEDRVGSLEAIALGLARLLSPLERDLKDGNARVFLAQLGLQLPPAAAGVPAFNTAVQNVVTATGQLPDLVERLTTDLGGSDYGPVVTTGVDITRAAVTTITGIADIASAIRGMSGATGIPAGTLNTFADNLPRRLVDYLVVRNLESAPVVPEVLEFIGVIERNLRNSGSTDPNLPEFTEYHLHVDQASAFVQSPLDRLRTLYDWGNAGFDGGTLLRALQSLLTKAGFPAIVDDSVAPVVLDAGFVEASARTDVSPRGLELRVLEEIDVDNAVPFNQGGDWQLEALASGDIRAAARLLIQPDGRVTFTPPAAMSTGQYGLRFTAGKADGSPWLIFGDPQGSRLEVAKFIVEARAGLNFDSGASASADMFVGGEILGGLLRIDFSNADGFLGRILAGVNLQSEFGLGFGVSSAEGVYFAGSATLEIRLPAHIDLGPIDIDALTFSVGIEDSTFPVTVSANIGAEIGPIAAVVEQIGIRARLSIPPGRNQGNLGPLQFDIGFKPPVGAGLSVDAGPVKGGGYLFFDPDREEYAGALELVFSEWIALRAIALITTRMPDGSKGFSMLIIITVEFGTGIQLGFGFTLLGVGGLLGIHRIVKIEPLAAGVRTGAIESVMFPTNIIANAPRIISDLRAFFPPQQDIFLLGPMAKIGWGTPTLLSVSLGIILEIPSINITILGVIKLVLPHEDAAISASRSTSSAGSSPPTSCCGSTPSCTTAACCSSRSRAAWGCSSAGATPPTSW